MSNDFDGFVWFLSFVSLYLWDAGLIRTSKAATGRIRTTNWMICDLWPVEGCQIFGVRKGNFNEMLPW